MSAANAVWPYVVYRTARKSAIPKRIYGLLLYMFLIFLSMISICIFFYLKKEQQALLYF